MTLPSIWLSRLFCVLCFLSSQFSTAQKPPAEYRDYQPIKARGELPVVFKKYSSISSKVKSNNDKLGEVDQNSTINRFYSTTSYNINKLLFSGKFLFGDPLSNYLNEVAKKVINDEELYEKLNFFTFKSSSINAFSTHEGIIGINIGLLAKLETESELAFILSHEVSHFLEEHSFDGYSEKYTVINNPGNYSRESLDDRFDQMLTFSREREFEADSLGIIRLMKSDYNNASGEMVVEKLHYSYLPFKQVPFDKEFFNIGSMKVPESLFLDSITPISDEIITYNDRHYTHPNVDDRIKALKRIRNKNANKKETGKDFAISQSKFKEIRELARFEMIRLDLFRRNYGNLVYNAFTLLQNYPDNEYLEVNIAKALYGIAKYKNADELHRAASSYTDLEGESQQVHYFIKETSTKQFTTLAIKYIRHINEKHPGNTNLKDFEKDLFKDLVVQCELKADNFYKDIPEEEVSDYSFYRLAFIDEFKEDENFRENFDQHLPLYAKKKKWEVMSYKEREKKQKKKEKKLKKEGANTNVEKPLFLDPYYKVYDRRSILINEAEEKQKRLIARITEKSKKEGTSPEILNSSFLFNSPDIDYNTFSSLKEWSYEIFAHGKIKVLPLFSDEISEIIEDFGTQWLVFSGVYEKKESNQTYYDFHLYNLKNGDCSYSNNIMKKRIGKCRLKRYLKKDIRTISN